MNSRVDLLTSFQRASNGFDMRGVVESSGMDITKLDGPLLSYDAAFWVGVGFGQWLKKSTDKLTFPDDDASLCVGIGRDSRGSGSELTRWLAGGLEAVGVRAYDVGLCTTPAMYLSCIDSKTDIDDSTKYSPWPFNGAISVTASHLPSNWNGFKFFTPSTPSNIGEEGIQGIIDCCAEKAFDIMVPTAVDFSGRIMKSYIPSYSDFLKKTVRQLVLQSMVSDPMNNIGNEAIGNPNEDSNILQYPLKGLKICVNAGNGCGGFLAQTLLDLGADTSSSLHLDPDGSFPNHIANPEDRKAIQCTLDAVIRGNADLGVCLDTDADRVGLVEGINSDVSSCNSANITEGRLLNRNCLIALVSKVALRGVIPGSAGKGVVVTDSATSNGLSRFIEGTLGGKHVRFKKGYRYVIEKGRSIDGCVVAVECSGHGAWKDNGWVDDGCYTAVKLIAELSVMRRLQANRLAGSLLRQKNTIGLSSDYNDDPMKKEPICRLSDLLQGLEGD